jgi:hypothetical protein
MSANSWVILRKFCGLPNWNWNGFNWLKTGSSEGCCEEGDERVGTQHGIPWTESLHSIGKLCQGGRKCDTRQFSVRVKTSPWSRPIRGVKEELHRFLISVLDSGVSSASRSDPFTAKKKLEIVTKWRISLQLSCESWLHIYIYIYIYIHVLPIPCF